MGGHSGKLRPSSHVRKKGGRGKPVSFPGRKSAYEEGNRGREGGKKKRKRGKRDGIIFRTGAESHQWGLLRSHERIHRSRNLGLGKKASTQTKGKKEILRFSSVRTDGVL